MVDAGGVYGEMIALPSTIMNNPYCHCEEHKDIPLPSPWLFALPINEIQAYYTRAFCRVCGIYMGVFQQTLESVWEHRCAFSFRVQAGDDHVPRFVASMARVLRDRHDPAMECWILKEQSVPSLTVNFDVFLARGQFCHIPGSRYWFASTQSCLELVETGFADDAQDEEEVWTVGLGLTAREGLFVPEKAQSKGELCIEVCRYYLP